MKYNTDKTPPECDERIYWHKRFNFASWLFLGIGFYFLFFTEAALATLLALSFSIGWRALDSVCYIRHFNWHIREELEGKHDHR